MAGVRPAYKALGGGVRQRAHAAGLSRYFTGRACPHGHVVERRVSDGKCIECQRLKKARWRNEAKAKIGLMCRVCGQPLAGVRRAISLCSKECRKRAESIGKAAARKALAHRLGGRRFTMSPDAYRRAQDRKRDRKRERRRASPPRAPRFCSECGSLVMRGHRALTCSGECYRTRHKRLFSQSEEARERSRTAAKERDRQDRILLAAAKRLLRGELV